MKKRRKTKPAVTKGRFSAKDVARLGGIKYPTIHDWATRGVLKPEIQSAQGTGTQRKYSFDDVVAAKVAAGFRKFKLSVPHLARIIARARGASKETSAGTHRQQDQWVGFHGDRDFTTQGRVWREAASGQHEGWATVSEGDRDQRSADVFLIVNVTAIWLELVAELEREDAEGTL